MKRAQRIAVPSSYSWPFETDGEQKWISRRARSVFFAAGGIWHLVRAEPNARIHAIATLLVVALGMAMRVQAQGWCWLIAAMGAVWVAEAMNTALELLADAACPEWDPLVGRAKDVAAGAVLLAAIAAVGIGVCVFGSQMG